MLRQIPGPRVHLPFGTEAETLFMLWSAEGFPTIVNGRSGFVPALQDRLAERWEGFPDFESVAALRSLGVRNVVLHPELAAASSWAGAANRSIEGLGVTTVRRGGVVWFNLEP